jgi:hypothetical protein
MNRRTILNVSLIATFGLASLPGDAAAQTKSLKEQLVGAWTLVSCDFKQPPFVSTPICVKPNGILILDASGRYSSMTVASGRPKGSDANRNRVEIPAEEYKAVAQGVAANFGTWSVNEADKTMTEHRDGALFPSVEGTDAKVSVSLTGDEVKLVGQVGESVYRRAK